MTVTKSKPLTRENNSHGLLWWLRVICVFIFVSAAWTFFRANTLNEAIYIFKNCFNGITNFGSYLSNSYFDIGAPKKVFMSIPVLIIFDYLALKFDVLKALTANKYFIFRYAFYFGIIVAILLLRAADEVTFVYFQF